ncbi:pyruvate kinase [Patescibacteria group bacterium]|nr:pyruvate kinase [Patescibacteria group bacterium]MBU1921954.1 pyruvate kinase [Patescibacteria group bacterium]
MKLEKRTKIVCTIGPSSAKTDVLRQMIGAGMNVARLNFSHGTYAEHRNCYKNIRAAAKALDEPVAIIADLQGPKIRVGVLPARGVKLKPGEEIVLSTARDKYKDEIIPVTYKMMHRDVKQGDIILLDDGLIELKVSRVKGGDIHAKVAVGGILTSHKGINLPTTVLSVPAITKKDKKDLKFAVSLGVDFVALSFVKSANDIYDLRYIIKAVEKKYKKKNPDPIKIIAKIEKHEAIKNFKEILEATDGIMVARGDLGIEIPAEDVPLAQKNIIEKCLEAAKPVIVATQMLESMTKKPRPTRAEVSDVANAIIDHTDAVMLSAETASGKYPVKTVETMSKIIKEAERSHYDDLVFREYLKKFQSIDEAISRSARLLAAAVDARLILTASLSGNAGRMISRYRPELPIFVTTDGKRVLHQLNLSWAVRPFILPQCRSIEELVDRSLGYLKKYKFVKTRDKIIIIAGEPVGRSGRVNLVEIREVL